MGEHIEIVIGAAIKGDEGFVGEVEGIDLDPSGTFAERVVVRPRHEGGTARLVPAAVLEPASNGGLRLHRTPEEFEQFPAIGGRGR